MKKLIKISHLLTIIIAPIVLIPFVIFMVQKCNAGPGFDAESFEIESISAEEIVADGDYFKSYNSSQKHAGLGSGISSSAKYSEVDFHTCEFSCKKISGKMTASATKFSNATVNLRIDSTLNDGEMKIFIVQDGKIVGEVPTGEIVDVQYSATEESLIYVRVIAKDANMKIIVTRDIVDN